jgi:hypothetical protein
MSEWQQPPPAEVPTLTEIIDDAPAHQGGAVVLPLRGPVRESMRDVQPEVPAEPLDTPPFKSDELAVPTADLRAAPTPFDPTAEIDEDALFLDVLAEVRTQVDRLLDYRLREAMAPVVERAVELLIQDAKAELSITLHDVLRRAVAQVIARNRPR